MATDLGRDTDIGVPDIEAFDRKVSISNLDATEDIKEATIKIESLLKRKPLTWKDTGVGSAITTFIPGFPYKLLEVRFHLGSALAAAETLTLTRTAFGDESVAYYNVVLLSQDLGTAGILDLSLVFGPEEGYYTELDSIVSALSANTGGDRWGLEIVYEKV